MATKKRGTRSSTRGGARRTRKAVPAGFGGSQPPGDLIAQLKAQLTEAREALKRAEQTLAALSRSSRKTGKTPVLRIGPTGPGDQE